MFRRAVVSGLAGLTIAVLLFLIMHVLIARSQRARSYPDAYPIVDFVRLAPEAQPPPRDEREPPEEPDPPEVPPTPSFALQTANQPQLPAPQIEMTAAITSGPLLDMTPLAAPASNKQTVLSGHELMPLVRVPPRYPGRAARLQIEGSVTVEFTITADGSVADPAVIESDPPRVFDKAALQAIVQWKFKPRVEDGQAVESRASQRIEFALGGG